MARWTGYQRSIAELILKHRVDTPAGYDYNAVVADLPPGMNKSKVSAIAKALREANWKLPDEAPAKETKSAASTAGAPMAVVKTKIPAPFVFTFGETEIAMDGSKILESYLLFSDLQVRCGLKSTFSDFLQDGAGLLWRILGNDPVIENGKVLAEVNNGRSAGRSDEETGDDGEDDE